ncbi:hypothetical protein GA0004734_00026240 [Rhizobium sp. 9140]|nr:hypothetical protein GA0004734_00026240 [Rhizobium sp. 9140]
MSPLVHNERLKLVASSLDRLSTALVVVGVLGPVVALTPSSASLWSVFNATCWLIGAVILHLISQRVLGRLKT